MLGNLSVTRIASAQDYPSAPVAARISAQDAQTIKSWMPADGISAAAQKKDFGTSR
jgi:hypothetical protein